MLQREAGDPVAVNAHQRALGYIDSIGALLDQGGKNFLEVVCSVYRPGSNCQAERTRGDWKSVFYLDDIWRNRRIVKYRDTGDMGNRFFQQLQPLAAKISR